MENSRKIIHVDMDAFYASVEVRDNPALIGKPVIIGALPDERGVVATCSYEARKFGVHSAMNIKEAYARCPEGIFMHGNMDKYRKISAQLHEIWKDYADTIEYIACDEGYLDVTESQTMFGGAENIAKIIKQRTKKETGLTCSVGIGYSMAAAKMASEEKKPDGFYKILTPGEFVDLIIDRDIRVIYGIGKKTAEKLNHSGIYTVRDLRNNAERIAEAYGKMGRYITDMAFGVDNRKVTEYKSIDAKSMSREVTFQKDTYNFSFLKDVLMVLANSLQNKMRKTGLYGRTVTLKITYADMKSITRSKTVESSDSGYDLYTIGSELLDGIETNAVRLIGIGFSNLSESYTHQISFEELSNPEKSDKDKIFDDLIDDMEKRYGIAVKRESKKERTFDSLYGLIEKMDDISRKI